MAWNSYGLDRKAQRLVLLAKDRDSASLNQAHKMRMAVAYGLERFWGEHLRLQGRAADESKARFWKSTWDALVEVMEQAGVTIPNDEVNPSQVRQIQEMSSKLWDVQPEEQRVAIAVLTQLCDCIVWWTQRYK
jgi:hypothetical protein